MPEENKQPAPDSRSRNGQHDETWTLKDLISFEAAVAKDGNESWEKLEKRDNAIGQEAPRDLLNGSRNRALLKFWLNRIKDEDSHENVIFDAYRLASKLLFAMAIFAGGSIALELLQYLGAKPINVSAFFGLLILLQATLTLTTFGLLALPSSKAKHLRLSLGFQILKPVALSLAGMLANVTTKGLRGDQRESLLSLLGKTRSSLFLYGSVLRWKLFQTLQGTAVAFNLGALAAILLVIAFSDKAFGWQTTLDLNSDAIHSLIRFVAIPWSWLWGEGLGYPSHADIEGSRIVLKDGIQGLSSEHLVSWWPFLSLGIFVYGLLPRSVFVLWTHIRLRASLKKLDFSHGSAQRIIERMKRPSVGFNSEKVQHEKHESDDGAVGTQMASLAPQSEGTTLAFVNESIWQQTDEGQLAQKITESLNLQLENLKLFQLTLEKIAQPNELPIGSENENALLVLVFESWMPPLEETKRLLRELRSRLKRETPIRILLTGKPASGSSFQKPVSTELEMWSLTISQLGDPYCLVDPLV